MKEREFNFNRKRFKRNSEKSGYTDTRSATRIVALLVTLILAISLSGCGASPNNTGNSTGSSSTPGVTTGAGDTSAGQTFTLSDLKKFDGQNGNKAYVAIDGTVYDVTGVPQWANGQHNGLQAGNDLSDAINSSPHGKAILSKLNIVGTLK